MGNYNYETDRPSGKIVETEFREVMSNAGYSVLNVNRDNKYDAEISLNGISKKFEVKNDEYASKSGNIVIEFKCRGKLSGIETTEADYYAIKAFNQFYISEVQSIKKLILEKKYKFIAKDAGDVGSNTHCYIFDEKIFGKICTLVIKCV